MSGFKSGDRVHVEFDAEVSEPMKYSPDYIAFKCKGVEIGALPGEFFTLVRPPLRVGDILTADDPEPPEGTVVRTRRGITCERVGLWYRIRYDQGLDWEDVDKIGAIVLYVPEGTP